MKKIPIKSRALTPDDKNIQISIRNERIEQLRDHNQSLRDRLKGDIARVHFNKSRGFDVEVSAEELEEQTQEDIQENLDEIAKLEAEKAALRRGENPEDLE